MASRREAPPEAGSERKGRKTKKPGSEDATGRKESPRDTGMPAAESIVSERTFKSPKGHIYRMIESNEVDEYEEPPRTDDEPGRTRR